MSDQTKELPVKPFQWSVSVDDGKYEVVFDANNRLLALRCGEPWRECIGDNLIYFLAVELMEARAPSPEVEKLKALLRESVIMMKKQQSDDCWTREHHELLESLISRIEEATKE